MPIGDKYVSIHTVASRIARNHKGLAFDISDIAEWCFEVVKNIGKYDHFIEYKGVVLEVENLKAKLPCDVYRLLSVKNNGKICSNQTFYNDGTYLNFGTIGTPVEVVIDYIGFAVDEDGFPLIEDSAQEACFWYCLSRIMLEQYLNGDIPTDRYQMIDSKYNHYVSVARGGMRFMSRNDLSDIHRTAINIIRRSRYPKTERESPRP